MSDPFPRLRRLRRSPELRAMLDLPPPGPERFVWPLFVCEGTRVKDPIGALPGQYRWSVDRLDEALAPVVDQGVNAVLVFGLPDPAAKDPAGSAAADPAGVVPRAVAEIRRRRPRVVVITDVCLCAYTDHGHCGPLDAAGAVDNDAAVAALAAVAVAHARAGATIVAPSAMMDGQVAAVRAGLDAAGFAVTAIMSYSTKFASACYDPFRDAGRSAPAHGDRRGYQAPPGDPRQARRESAQDAAEGADYLMVKPALFYLDVVAAVRAATDLPLAVYNVSGEYAMLAAAAERGWGDLRALVRESVVAMARAGADIVISYWADRYAEFFGAAGPAVKRGRA